VAVEFATAGTGAATTSGTVSVPYPPGLSAGDTLICHVLTKVGTAIATPSGWTLISSGVPGDGAGLHAAYRKTAAGSESGSLSVSTTDSEVIGVYGRMYRFTGANGSEGAGQEGGSSDTIPDRTVTTSGADRLAVNLVAIEDDVTVAAFTGMTGGTWAEAVGAYETTIGFDATLQIQVAQIASAGTINGGTQTIATTESYHVIGFALIAGNPPVAAVAAVATASGTPPTISLVDFKLISPPSARATASGPTPADFPQEDIEFYAAVDFGGGYEQLDERVRTATIHRGRNSNLERVEAGTAQVVFKNGDGHLDPANAASSLYGDIRPLLPIRIMRRIDGITYERLTGPIERWLPTWVAPTYQEMQVEAADNFERLANVVCESDYATAETALAGANNDLVFTAREAGARGDEITVQYVVAGNDTNLAGETNDPLMGNSIFLSDGGSVSGNSAKLYATILYPSGGPPPISFTVQGTDITVNVETNSFGNPVSTAADIKEFIEGSPELDALVTVAHASGSSGAGIVAAMAPISLTGGKWPEELSGARINRILDLAGWPAGLRDIDSGDFVVVPSGFSVRDNVSALTHIKDVADSELGYVFMRGDNTFVYHDASHRNVAPRSTSSNATFTNAGGPGFRFQDIRMSLDKDAIINEVTVTGGVSTSVPQTAVDAASQAAGYGVRSVSRSTLLANDEDCLAQAVAIVEAFAFPLQRVESLTCMEVGEPGWTEALLALDIGDRITLVAEPPVESGASSTTTSYQLFVEAITDSYAPGVPLTLTFTTSAAEQSVAAPPPPGEQYVLNNLGGILVVGDPVNGIIAGETSPNYTASPSSAVTFAAGPTPTVTGAGVTVSPAAAVAFPTGRVPTITAGGVTVTVPAAALASAAGGTFTADLIVEPLPAAATGSGPTPNLGGNITVSPAAAGATATAGLTKVNLEIGPTAAAATGSSTAATVNIT
jgi:hypothetical protein